MPVETRIQSLPNLVSIFEGAVRRSIALDKPILVSLITSWEPVDLLKLFHRATELSLTRVYWSTPSSTLSMIGIGETHRLVGQGDERFQQIMDEWHRLLQDHITVSEIDVGTDPAGPILMGGFSFFPRETLDSTRARFEAGKDDWWTGYPDGLMICPQLLVTQTGQDTWLTQNVWVDAASKPQLLAQQMIDFLHGIIDDDMRDVGNALHAKGDSLSNYDAVNDDRGADHRGLKDDETIAGVTIQSQEATEARFKRLVQQATAELGNGDLQKIVIAESTDVSSGRPFRPAQVLSMLADEYPECTRFAVGIGPRSFVGATPERLVALSGNHVKVTCLAGSAPRAQDPVEDRALGMALLNDPKNLIEHNWVIHMVREALEPLCDRLDIAPQPTLLTLNNVQHLYTPVQGVIDENKPVNILTLVKALHPTPAVGGFPQTSSSRWIKQHEAFDRGWYAAPVGWVSPSGDGEFVVAIRSGLIEGDRARLFAGCGIVAGSEQHAEFLESQLKLAPMLRALGRSIG